MKCDRIPGKRVHFGFIIVNPETSGVYHKSANKTFSYKKIPSKQRGFKNYRIFKYLIS